MLAWKKTQCIAKSIMKTCKDYSNPRNFSSVKDASEEKAPFLQLTQALLRGVERSELLGGVATYRYLKIGNTSPA